VTYPEAIQFLYGLQLFGANFGLERVRQLAALAGNPQDRLRFIHVAGTNGKGSVCALLESVYRAAGLRTGCSRHLTLSTSANAFRSIVSPCATTRWCGSWKALLHCWKRGRIGAGGMPADRHRRPLPGGVIPRSLKW